jgi:hypothetical protein
VADNKFATFSFAQNHPRSSRLCPRHHFDRPIPPTSRPSSIFVNIPRPVFYKMPQGWL